MFGRNTYKPVDQENPSQMCQGKSKILEDTRIVAHSILGKQGYDFILTKMANFQITILFLRVFIYFLIKTILNL